MCAIHGGHSVHDLSFPYPIHTTVSMTTAHWSFFIYTLKIITHYHPWANNEGLPVMLHSDWPWALFVVYNTG